MNPRSKIGSAACTIGMATILLGCTPGARAAADEEGAPASSHRGASQVVDLLGLPPCESPGCMRIHDAPPGDKEDAAAAAAKSPPDRQDELTLIAGGDVCFGREVGQALLRDPTFDPFASIAPLLASASLRFVNLESQLSDQDGETQSKHHPLVFTGPPGGADALARAGIRVVSAANNHMWDYGERAFFETLANLERAGVAHPGAGRSRLEAYTPVIVEHGGFRVAVLAVTDIWNQGSLARHAARDYVATADRDAMAATVRRVRAEQRADAVFVSYHGGVEYTDRPLPETRALARFVIDNGADAFIGHHPHVLQGIELRHGKPIFYSLGNFIMNVNTDEEGTDLGMLVRLRLRRGAPPISEVCPIRSGGMGAVPLTATPEREAALAAFTERIRRASVRYAHAPEVGPFGADGCAPLLSRDSKNRAATAQQGAARQRTGL